MEQTHMENHYSSAVCISDTSASCTAKIASTDLFSDTFTGDPSRFLIPSTMSWLISAFLSVEKHCIIDKCERHPVAFFSTCDSYCWVWSFITMGFCLFLETVGWKNNHSSVKHIFYVILLSKNMLTHFLWCLSCYYISFCSDCGL